MDEYRAVDIGIRIMANRVRAGLTQSQLAERAGVTQGHVSMVESGRREPSYGLAERLLHECGASLIVSRARPNRRTPDADAMRRALEERDGLRDVVTTLLRCIDDGILVLPGSAYYRLARAALSTTKGEG